MSPPHDSHCRRSSQPTEAEKGDGDGGVEKRAGLGAFSTGWQGTIRHQHIYTLHPSTCTVLHAAHNLHTQKHWQKKIRIEDMHTTS